MDITQKSGTYGFSAVGQPFFLSELIAATFYRRAKFVDAT